jgi:MFS family permease
MPRMYTGPMNPDAESAASEASDPAQPLPRSQPTPNAEPAQVIDSPQAPRLPRESGIRYAFSSLKNRNFMFLWLGMVCLMAGINMQMIARGYLVYEITERPLLLGIVNVGAALPILGLSLFGGAIADRMDRRRIIQGGQFISLALTLAVAVLITMDAVTWQMLFVASMLQGAMWAFMMPARQAIIPQIVGKENVTNALALNAAGMSATTLIAPAVAGWIYAGIGPAGVYYVIAALGFFAVVFTTLVRYERATPVGKKANMRSDIADGLGYIVKSPMVLLLLIMGGATTMLAMPFRFLIPVFVVELYDRGPEALGLLVSVMGLGSLAGAMFIASMGKWRRGVMLIAGSLMSGLGLILVAAFPFYMAAVAIMVLLGLGDATRRTLNETLIMEVVEDRFRGRVMSVFMMNFGLMPLGVLPAGLAIEFYGGQATAAFLGITLVLVASGVLVTQRKLRNFE